MTWVYVGLGLFQNSAPPPPPPAPPRPLDFLPAFEALERRGYFPTLEADDLLTTFNCLNPEHLLRSVPKNMWGFTKTGDP